MEKIKIDLDIILPDVPDEKDARIQRITVGIAMGAWNGCHTNTFNHFRRGPHWPGCDRTRGLNIGSCI